MTSVHPRHRRGHAATALTLFAVAFGLYVMTLAPTVTSEDSGELIAAAHFFGIPHPPGYPLWTMLCGSFLKLVPIGDAAYRANLFSALCSSLACMPLFMSFVAIGLRRASAFSAALTFAVSGTLWSQSVIAEVYGLNALLCSTLLWIMIKWYTTDQNRWLLAAAGVCGLGMCNHHTIGFVALAFVVWALACKPSLIKSWRLAGGCLCAFLLALAPYAYLPIRAAADPPINWGNPSDAGAFWDQVSRKQYGSVAPVPITRERSLERFAEQLLYCSRIISNDLTVPVTALALVGLFLQFRRRSAYVVLVMLVVATSGVLFLFVSNLDLDRTQRHAMRVFFIPLAMMLTLPLAVALDAIQSTLSHARQSVIHAFGAGAMLAVPLLPALANFNRCNYADYWYANDHARNLLASMLPGAIVFPSSDHNTFPLVFMTLVQGERDDVTVADKYGFVDPAVVVSISPAEADRVLGLSDHEQKAWIIRKARRPVYFTTKEAPPVPNASFVSVGLLYLLLPDGKSVDRDSPWSRISYRNNDARPSAIDRGADHILGDERFFRGLDHLRRHEKEEALRAFAQCAERMQGIKEAFNNIGSALAEHAHVREAIPYFEEAAAMDDRYLSPRRNLAVVYSGLKNWPQTRHMLREAVAIAPDDPRAYAELGFLALRVDDDRESATQYFRDALARDPDQANVVAALSKLMNREDGD